MQRITVDASHTHLSYWIWIGSNDLCIEDAGGVAIDDGNETEVVDAFFLCLATNTNGWVRRTVDLRGYAGRTVILIILAGTDEILTSSLFVDDVALVSSAVGAESSLSTPAGSDKLESIVYRLAEGLLSSTPP